MPGLLSEHHPVAGLEVIDLDKLLGVGEGGEKLGPPRGSLGLFPVIELLLVTE